MFKRIIIAAAASLALVVATGGAALADMEPPPSNDCVPEHIVHHDAVPETTHTVHHEAVPETTHVVPGALITPAIWANFSPNDTKGPFQGTPGYPTDPGGTWNDHGQLPPGQAGTDGVYKNGNGNGDWFYRHAAVYGPPTTVGDGNGTDAYDSQVGNGDGKDAWDETVPATGDCTVPLPQDAGANVTITPATCDAPGSASGISGTNATIDASTPLDSTPGEHTANFTALPGHLFANGTAHLTVDVHRGPPEADRHRECPTSFDVAALNTGPTPPTCTAAGTYDTGLAGGTTVDGVTTYMLDDGKIQFNVERNTPGEVHLYVFSNDYGVMLAGLSAEWSLNADGYSAQRIVKLLPKDTNLCPKFQVPATFNAAPGAPTCTADGTLPDFGGTFLLERDGVRYYSFQGDTVRLSVERVGLTVHLYVFAVDDKTILTGLTGWNVNADSRSGDPHHHAAAQGPAKCPRLNVAQFNAPAGAPTCAAARHLRAQPHRGHVPGAERRRPVLLPEERHGAPLGAARRPGREPVLVRQR